MDLLPGKRRAEDSPEPSKHPRLVADPSSPTRGAPSSDDYDTDSDVRRHAMDLFRGRSSQTATQGRAELAAPSSAGDSAKKKRPGTRVPSSGGTRGGGGGDDKNGKGLRQFSLRVCQKVQEKGCTTYNEVADELVEECAAADPSGIVGEEKNIRRRVYDALNVLMALDIIGKEKKEIRWNGLPTSPAHESSHLASASDDTSQRVRQKQAHFQELVLQNIVISNLAKRNAALPEKPDPKHCIALPFILVNTHKEAHIDCSMTPACTQFLFKFDMPFEIRDDIDILSRMGLNKCTVAELRAVVPRDMYCYLPPSAQGLLQGNDENAVITFIPQWSASVETESVASSASASPSKS